MRRLAVLSPRAGAVALEDLASRSRLIAGQRVDRYRLRRRVARRARWVAERLVMVALVLALVAASALLVRWLLASPRFAVTSLTVTGYGRSLVWCCK